MSLRPADAASLPAILRFAMIVAGLIAWPLLWPSDSDVHVRTAPFEFGHQAAARAEFLFTPRPPLV